MLYGQLQDESSDYRKAREDLLEAEIALREQRERVAEMRRKLPLETKVEDYTFREAGDGGVPREVSLSGLFEDPKKPLIVYQYMFGGAQKAPCPMCTLWVDGFNGIRHHIKQRLNFAVVAEAEIEKWGAWGRKREWTDLRLVSSAGSSFKSDLKFQDEEGDQYSGVSVFTLMEDGSVWHFYSACAIMKEDEFRGIDILTPMWNLLDLTPGGRGDWYPGLDY